MLSALTKASIVFSGATSASPRWASTRGEAEEKKPSSAPPRDRLLRGRPGIGSTSGPRVPEEAAADGLDRFGELRGNDPELAGLALRDLGKRQEVLVREQCRVRVTVVDGLEHGRDGARFTLGAQYCGLSEALGLENRRLPGAFRFEDLRLLRALGGQDDGAAVTLGTHLLLHRVLDGQGRVDGLQLNT